MIKKAALAAFAVVAISCGTAKGPSISDQSVDREYGDQTGNPGIFDDNPNAQAIDPLIDSASDDSVKAALNLGQADIDDIESAINIEVVDLSGFEFQPAIDNKAKPAITYGVLAGDSDCPIPVVREARNVITDNVDWQIFVYCELSLIGTEPIQKYPYIASLTHNASAYNFLKVATLNYLETYLPQAKSEAEKMALFEHIFFVSQFRNLTLEEKGKAVLAIEENGFHQTVRLYLANWYQSGFYQANYRFDQTPQVRYVPRLALGVVQDTDEDSIKEAVVEVGPTQIKGFRRKAKTHAGKSVTLSAELAAHYNIELMDYDYNYVLQFYSNLAGPTAAIIFAQHSDYFSNGTAVPTSWQVVIPKVVLDSLPEENTSAPVDPNDFEVGRDSDFDSDSWPDVGVLANSFIVGLDFSLPANFPKIDGCQVPGKSYDYEYETRVVNGYLWQDFVQCLLGDSPFANVGGLDYVDLTYKKSALDFAMEIAKSHRASQVAIAKTDIELAQDLFQVLAFRKPSASDSAKIKSSLNTFGFSQTLTSLIAYWYNSDSYSDNFDYSKFPHHAKSSYRLVGTVKDNDGQYLEAQIKLRTDTGEVIAEANTTNGTFEIIESFYEISESWFLEAASEGLPIGRLQVSDFQTELEQEKSVQLAIIIQANGNVSPAKGGGLQSTGFSLQFPAGAVLDETDFEVADDSDSIEFGGDTFLAEVKDITPGYDFEKPVRMVFGISDDLANSALAAIGDPDLTAEMLEWGIFTLDEETVTWVEILSSSYDSGNGEVVGYTEHFSKFAAIPKQLRNRALSQGSNRFQHSEPGDLGEVFHRAYVRYPTGLPAADAQARQLFAAHKYNEKRLNKIPLPGTCFNTGDSFTCGPMRHQSEVDEDISGRVRIRKDFPGVVPVSDLDRRLAYDVKVDGNAYLSGSAVLGIDVNRCSVSPRIDYPKMKVREFSSTDLTLSLYGDVHSSVEEPVKKCKNRFLGACVYYTWRFPRRNIYHKVYMSITDVNYPHRRNGISPTETIQYVPKYDINVKSWIRVFFRPSEYKGKRRAIHWGGAKMRRFKDTYKNKFRSRIKAVFEQTLKDNITEAINNEGIYDPVWDESNCHTLPPVQTFTSPSSGSYDAPQAVTFDHSPETAATPPTIFYTLDGSTPTTESAVYTDPIVVNLTQSNTTLKFFGIDADGNVESEINTAYFHNTSNTIKAPAQVNLLNNASFESAFQLKSNGSWSNGPKSTAYKKLGAKSLKIEKPVMGKVYMQSQYSAIDDYGGDYMLRWFSYGGYMVGDTVDPNGPDTSDYHSGRLRLYAKYYPPEQCQSGNKTSRVTNNLGWTDIDYNSYAQYCGPGRTCKRYSVDDWDKRTKYFTIPEGACGLIIQLNSAADNWTESEFYLDKFILKRVD